MAGLGVLTEAWREMAVLQDISVGSLCLSPAQGGKSDNTKTIAIGVVLMIVGISAILLLVLVVFFAW